MGARPALASSSPRLYPLSKDTRNEARTSTAKERPFLSFLLNPFGLGFPGLDSLPKGTWASVRGHSGSDQSQATQAVPCVVGHFPAGQRWSSHCGSPSLGETVKDGPWMETGVRPCPWVKEACRPCWGTWLLSPRPNHEKQPSPPTPSTNPETTLGRSPARPPSRLGRPAWDRSVPRCPGWSWSLKILGVQPGTGGPGESPLWF